MIFGFDLSRFDSDYPGDVRAVEDPWAEFDIFNIDDPECSIKVRRAHEIGKDWGLYGWVNPGDSGTATSRLQAMADLLELDGLSQPQKGLWLDYEEEGVGPDNLAANLAPSRQAVVKTELGAYTYLYLIQRQPELLTIMRIAGVRLWLAFYPGNNDGSFPAWAIGDAQNVPVNGERSGVTALLWQFSSSGGQRDRNVVVDEAAWRTFGGAPAPAATREDDDMGAIKLATVGGRPFGFWIEGGHIVYRGFNQYGVPLQAITIPTHEGEPEAYECEADAQLTVDDHGRVLAPSVKTGLWVVATAGTLGYTAVTL